LITCKDATDEDSLILTMGDDYHGVDFPYNPFSSVSKFVPRIRPNQERGENDIILEKIGLFNGHIGR